MCTEATKPVPEYGLCDVTDSESIESSRFISGGRLVKSVTAEQYVVKDWSMLWEIAVIG